MKNGRAHSAGPNGRGNSRYPEVGATPATRDLRMRCTPGEARNGFTDQTIDDFFRSSMSTFEFLSEMLRREGEHERQCYLKLAEWQSAHGEFDRDDLTTMGQKELAALELDLAAARNKRLAVADALENCGL